MQHAHVPLRIGEVHGGVDFDGRGLDRPFAGNYVAVLVAGYQVLGSDLIPSKAVPYYEEAEGLAREDGGQMVAHAFVQTQLITDAVNCR